MPGEARTAMSPEHVQDALGGLQQRQAPGLGGPWLSVPPDPGPGLQRRYVRYDRETHFWGG